MNKIRRISIFGPPCSGKTTLSAKLFADLKIAGFKIALMDEYIQKCIRNGINIQSFDQFYVFAKLLNQEDIALRGGFDLIITDAPLLINTFYTKQRKDCFWREELSIAKKFERKYPSLNIFLKLPDDKEKFQNVGRIHNFEEAKDMENDMLCFLIDHCPNIISFDRENYNGVKQSVIESIKKSEEPCEKCGGAGWLWWYELKNYSGPADDGGADDTKYSCDECSKYDDDDDDIEY